MRISQTLKRAAALGVATAALSSVAATAPAVASVATAPTVATEVDAQALPTCVKGWVNSGIVTQTAYAKNNCSVTYRVRILWDWGLDGPCQTMDPGDQQSHQVAITPRVFAGLASC
ncbi:hypothetical protein [Streptomyces albipurpureus]|uniref:hypothetical protein n=1 Tax=Streptomyces albipurpureus TaxID=2897419 RepID=UPI003CE4991F